jgi:hypothetical protein
MSSHARAPARRMRRASPSYAIVPSRSGPATPGSSAALAGRPSPPRAAPALAERQVHHCPAVRLPRPSYHGREGQGLGPCACLGSCGHALGGHRAYNRGRCPLSAVERDPAAHRRPPWMRSGELLPLSRPPPSTTRESRHDPLGELLVPRRPSTEPLQCRSPAHGGHHRRPPVRRSLVASKGRPTPWIEPLGVGDPLLTHSRPWAWVSLPDSGEPRRPPPRGTTLQGFDTFRGPKRKPGAYP